MRICSIRRGRGRHSLGRDPIRGEMRIAEYYEHGRRSAALHKSATLALRQSAPTRPDRAGRTDPPGCGSQRAGQEVPRLALMTELNDSALTLLTVRLFAMRLTATTLTWGCYR